MRCSTNTAFYLYRHHLFLLTCKIILTWLFCSPNPKLRRRDLVFSPLLQMFHIINQALFRAQFNEVLHCLVLLANTKILLKEHPRTPTPCCNMNQSFPIFIFICSLINFSLDGSEEMSNSSHLLQTVVQSPPKKETTQAFYF